jgi:uncharacterized repeat protein (TIGR04076 family)
MTKDKRSINLRAYHLGQAKPKLRNLKHKGGIMTQPSEKIPDIKVTVKSIKGKCALRHKVGEEFFFKGGIAPGGLCTEGMLTVIPAARTLMFGGTHFWEKDPDTISVCCPDAKNLVVFEIRRVKS